LTARACGAFDGGMTDLNSPLSLARGPAMKNRFMLAPLTNIQSHADGVLSDDEFRWLVKRAEGGFGVTMTCAAHVQAGTGLSGPARHLRRQAPRRPDAAGGGAEQGRARIRWCSCTMPACVRPRS
jgi:hypothetical protein